MQNWSNPPEIRQKLGVRQKYFLTARRLSNPPAFGKSGGENRHLATLIASSDCLSPVTSNDEQKILQNSISLLKICRRTQNTLHGYSLLKQSKVIISTIIRL
jgi:hypothetical protein